MRIHRNAGMIASLTGVAIMATFATSGCGNNSANGEASAAASLASADGATDLSGTWVLNKDLSDHPRRPDSSGRPDGWQCPDSSGRPNGWRPRGGRGGRGPRPDSLRDGEPMRGPMTLVIEQTDSTVEITGGCGRTRVLYPDGRVVTHSRGDDGVSIEITASWDAQDQLVVVGTGPRGGTHTETISLSADGRRLFIDKYIDPVTDREPRSFRRVFDAASARN